MSEKAIYTKAEVDKLLKATYRMGMEDVQKKNTNKSKRLLIINVYASKNINLMTNVKGNEELQICMNGLSQAISQLIAAQPTDEQRQVMLNILFMSIKEHLKMEDK